MTQSLARCPACSVSSFRVLGQKNGFEMRSCNGCGTLAAAGDYSKTDSLYEEIYARPQELSIGTRAGLRRILDRLDGARASGRMLDYGFGAGDLMREARDRGWDVAGIEYSDNARDRAREDGFDVAKDAAGFSPGTYDVVTMIEVVEHLPDARKALGEAFGLLRPGGFLYVTTPNARGLNARFLGLDWSVVGPPDHRVLFSRGGLIALARAAGFRVESVRAEGLNPSEWRTRQRSAGLTTSGPAPAANLNDRMEASRALSIFKRTTNLGLSALGLGDTLKMMARRP